MSLSIEGLFSLELKARTHAERLRAEASARSESPDVDVRASAANVRRDADGFDMMGDIFVGLQGNWTVLGPMVRSSYLEVTAEFARRKAAAETSKAEDVAA